MTLRRWAYQEKAIKNAIGQCLNIGAANDWPDFAGKYGDKIVNTDLHDFIPGADYLYSGPNDAKVEGLRFDCTKAPWPITDKLFDTVIMGEILEHLTNLGAVTALKEARRVADYLVITTPLDPDFLGSDDEDALSKGGAHISLMTEDVLRLMLELAGWELIDWEEVDYEFTPTGFFITAVDSDKVDTIEWRYNER